MARLAELISMGRPGWLPRGYRRNPLHRTSTWSTPLVRLFDYYHPALIEPNLISRLKAPAVSRRNPDLGIGWLLL
jgi:hypothetical protein